MHLFSDCMVTMHYFTDCIWLPRFSLQLQDFHAWIDYFAWFDMLKFSKLLYTFSKNFSLVTNLSAKLHENRALIICHLNEVGMFIKLQTFVFWLSKDNGSCRYDFFYSVLSKDLSKRFLEISAYRMMKAVTLMRERKGLKRSHPQLAV